MAESLGEVCRERRGMTPGGRPRWRYYVAVPVPNKDGKGKHRKRIYSAVDKAAEERVALTKASANGVLQAIRNAVRGGKTIERAVAEYLSEREEDLVSARWNEWIKRLEVKRREDPKCMTRERLNELRRHPIRGYLDFFRGAYVTDLTSPDLVKWLEWLRAHWPAPTPGAKRRKPTEAETAHGIRGFHGAKMRHHVVNDFLVFDAWLVSTGATHPREHRLKKPQDLPQLPKKSRKAPNEDLLQRYLDAIPEAKRGLFLARSRDGLRPSEARRMNVGDYDFRTGFLTIEREDTKTDESEASFRVDYELREWLEKWVPKEERFDPNRPLFVNPECFTKCGQRSVRGLIRRGKLPPDYEVDGRWQESSEVRVHNRACKASGVYFPPNFYGRHAAATHMMQRTKERTGVHDIDAVKMKMRHRDRRTTEGYIDVRALSVGVVERGPWKSGGARDEGGRETGS